MVAATAKSWEAEEPPGTLDVEEKAAWFREVMTQVCDASMLQIRDLPLRRVVYWWSPGIAELCAKCGLRRRRYLRCRRRKRHSEAEAAALYEPYREARRALQGTIARPRPGPGMNSWKLSTVTHGDALTDWSATG
ncbi:uncharacterized protein LOC114253899 [Monomorium pharaonis]|uniref:uncharacterized protein LOC114253899 n=1 Tax=Monomorium pharaonis TaxID=307658 RepID=UPI00102E15EF|nr:uncharacterized protein LOC114253899 [Monomorium pharaonis]